jgi:hypothetical protein
VGRAEAPGRTAARVPTAGKAILTLYASYVREPSLRVDARVCEIAEGVGMFRFLSLVVALAMVFVLAPASSFAQTGMTYITLDNPADPNPNSYYTILTGINNHGQISGATYYADVGFIYDAGTYKTIVSFYSGSVGGINDQGQVVWTSINNSYDYFNGFRNYPG